MTIFTSVDALIEAVNTTGETSISLQFPDEIKRDSVKNLEQITKLAEFIKGNTSIRFFDISHNNIGSKGAKAIGEGLKGNAAIISFDISHNNIGSKGAKAIGEGLKGNAAIIFSIYPTIILALKE